MAVRESIWGFRTDPAAKERCLCERIEGKFVLVQTEQTKLIRHSLYDFLLIFFFVYGIFRCCRLPYLWASWFHFVFTLVRLSFATCYCSNFSNEQFLIRFYFHFNQLRNIPAQISRYGKPTSVRGNQSARYAMTWKQAQAYNKGLYCSKYVCIIWLITPSLIYFFF